MISLKHFEDAGWEQFFSHSFFGGAVNHDKGKIIRALVDSPQRLTPANQ
jgi:hypothetical protein